MKTFEWTPERHWIFLWRLEKILYQNWAGTAIRYLKYKNGLVRTFWTKEQAQKRADILNGVANES